MDHDLYVNVLAELSVAEQPGICSGWGVGHFDTSGGRYCKLLGPSSSKSKLSVMYHCLDASHRKKKLHLNNKTPDHENSPPHFEMQLNVQRFTLLFATCISISSSPRWELLLWLTAIRPPALVTLSLLHTRAKRDIHTRRCRETEALCDFLQVHLVNVKDAA